MEGPDVDRTAANLGISRRQAKRYLRLRRLDHWSCGRAAWVPVSWRLAIERAMHDIARHGEPWSDEYERMVRRSLEATRADARQRQGS